MKANQSKQASTEFNTELDTSIIQELNDEVAASCSGGLAPVTLYEDNDFGGDSQNIYGNDDNLDNSVFGSGWNNKTSSIIVRSGTWQVFESDGYKGRSKILRPGRYPNARSFGLPNDSLTAIRRIS